MPISTSLLLPLELLTRSVVVAHIAHAARVGAIFLFDCVIVVAGALYPTRTAELNTTRMTAPSVLFVLCSTLRACCL